MLKMRLQRRGKKNYATFRVVVAEHTAPIKGKYVADIGWYNPHTNEFKVDPAETTKWLEQGVQPSPTVHNLLVDNGHLKKEKVTSWRKKKKEEEEKDAEEKPTEVKEKAEDSKNSEPEKEAKPEAEDKPKEKESESAEKAE